VIVNRKGFRVPSSLHCVFLSNIYSSVGFNTMPLSVKRGNWNFLRIILPLNNGAVPSVGCRY
jgi:hypothetical protein